MSTLCTLLMVKFYFGSSISIFSTTFRAVENLRRGLCGIFSIILGSFSANSYVIFSASIKDVKLFLISSSCFSCAPSSFPPFPKYSSSFLSSFYIERPVLNFSSFFFSSSSESLLLLLLLLSSGNAYASRFLGSGSLCVSLDEGDNFLNGDLKNKCLVWHLPA